jgi:hypothetical protein
MRAIVLAVLVAVGIGLVGTSNLSAAPANGAMIDRTAKVDNMVVQVQHWRRRSHWRWGSRGWARCHVPYSSRMVRC